MELWKRDEKLKKSTEPYFNSWVWNWFCSFNLGNRNHADAERLLKIWRRTQAKRCHIQIACIGVYNTLPQPHVHMVALGER
ncbi:MAG: hypothetical protein ABIK91_08540 [Pseudomonadota bacterium]